MAYVYDPVSRIVEIDDSHPAVIAARRAFETGELPPPSAGVDVHGDAFAIGVILAIRGNGAFLHEFSSDRIRAAFS
jgi:hypothetical protein